MRVVHDRIVAIDYTIRSAEGEIIESTAGGGPLAYLHGRSQIVPGIEQAIEGLDEGAELQVELPPQLAWGDRDPEALFVVPREAFPDDEDIVPGMTFSGTRPDGGELLFSIVRVGTELVLVDANHPLAGKTVRVWVAVREVLAATTEEIAEGRPSSREAPCLPA